MSYGGYGFPNNYGMTYQQPNGFQNNFNNDSRYNRYMNMVEQQNNNNSQILILILLRFQVCKRHKILMCQTDK